MKDVYQIYFDSQGCQIKFCSTVELTLANKSNKYLKKVMNLLKRMGVYVNEVAQEKVRLFL